MLNKIWKIKFIWIFMSVFLSISVWISMWFFSFCFAEVSSSNNSNNYDSNNYAEVAPFDLLGDLYSKAKSSKSSSDLWGKAKVSDIYKVSLDIVKNRDFIVMKESIDFVVNDLNTKYNNNNNNLCDKLTSDVIADILMVADDSFSKNIQDAMFDVHNKEAEIKRSTLADSCRILMGCVSGKEKSLAPHYECKRIVSRSYYNAVVAITDSKTFDLENFWWNLFQNGKDGDADYDLMLDAQKIGEIMFVWFKPPTEVLFFEMPDMTDPNGFWADAVNKWYDWPVNIDSAANIFEWWFDCPLWIEAGTNSVKSEWAGVWSWVSSNSINNNLVGVWDASNEDVIDDTVSKESQFYDRLWVVWNVCANFSECGNWDVEWLEECDDGNLEPWDGCSANCKDEYCGDWVLQEDLNEVCDYGWKNNNAAICKLDCTKNVCGDGFLLEKKEECDDGNLDDGDGCSSICKKEWWDIICWDNEVNTDFEECDDWNLSNTDACLSSCVKAKCGDGFVREFYDDCDDWNLQSGDGCSSLCEDENWPYCGDWIINVDGEECDDGLENSNNWACKLNCKSNVCWDSYIYEWKEECDDGNTDNNDCCASDCSNEVHLAPEDILLWLTNSINKKFDDVSDGDKNKEKQNTCFKKCQELPVSGRLLCMSNCLCIEESSDEMRWWFLKEGAFRVKICTIPSAPVEMTRGARVFSIEEIYEEYVKILKSLKDSGELPKNAQTKEFLELWVKDNSFADSFSFNLLFGWKPPFAKTLTDVAKSKIAKARNLIIKKKIFNVGWLPNVFAKRNKYVSVDDPAKEKIDRLNDPDAVSYKNALNKARDELYQRAQFNWDTLNSLVMEKQAIVIEELTLFLDMNLMFWKNTDSLFEDMLAWIQIWFDKVDSGS